MITKLLFGAAMENDHLAFAGRSKRASLRLLRDCAPKATQQPHTSKRKARKSVSKNGHVFKRGSALLFSLRLDGEVLRFAFEKQPIEQQ